MAQQKNVFKKHLNFLPFSNHALRPSAHGSPVSRSGVRRFERHSFLLAKFRLLSRLFNARHGKGHKRRRGDALVSEWYQKYLVLKSCFFGPQLIPLQRGQSQLSDDVRQPILQGTLSFCHIFNCVFQECAINHVSWVELRDLKSILGIVFCVLTQSLPFFSHSLAWISSHFIYNKWCFPHLQLSTRF